MQVRSRMDFDLWSATCTDDEDIELRDYVMRWCSLLAEDIAAHPELTVTEVLEQYGYARRDEADQIGASGSFYGAAVRCAAHFWVHGEELRRWHNLDTQIGDEGQRANAAGSVLSTMLLRPPSK